MKEPRFCLNLLPSAYLPPNFIPGPSQPDPAGLNSDNMQRHEPIRIYWKSSLHTRRDKGLLITGNNCFSLSKEKLKIMKIGLYVLPAIRRGNLSSPEKGKRGERNYDSPLSLSATVLPELLPSNHPLEFDSVFHNLYQLARPIVKLKANKRYRQRY